MASIALSLITNIFCVKILSSREIGNLYTFASVAYFGNALFFVGFDFSFQRKIKALSFEKAIDYDSMWKEIRKILPYGFSSTIALAILISLQNFNYTYLCVGVATAFLSVATFLGGLARNILLIAGKKAIVANSLFAEQAVKLFICYGSTFIIKPSALTIISSLAIAGMATALINYRYVRMCIARTPSHLNYQNDANDIKHTFLPVSGSALLNWLQLQAYRPAISQILEKPEIVGSVSFLTSLGGVGASAVLGTLAQLGTAKQFSSNGASSNQFVARGIIITLLLCLVSYPAAFVFLHVLQRKSLYGLELLVPLGVLIEGSNFILGILGNHASLTIKSFMPSLLATFCAALSVAINVYLLSFNNLLTPVSLGLILALSQCIAVVVLLAILSNRNHSSTILL